MVQTATGPTLSDLHREQLLRWCGQHVGLLVTSLSRISSWYRSQRDPSAPTSTEARLSEFLASADFYDHYLFDRMLPRTAKPSALQTRILEAVLFNGSLVVLNASRSGFVFYVPDQCCILSVSCRSTSGRRSEMLNRNSASIEDQLAHYDQFLIRSSCIALV